jgi:mannose/fructose-specific phosphotransferase system component IIA
VNGKADVVRVVLVTHGALGRELVRTAEAILGPQEGVAFVSNEESSLDGLVDAVRDAGGGPGRVVFLVDLLGGSCVPACRAIRAERGGETFAIAGVNLPMLLEFFYHRDRVPFAELQERLLAKGRDGVRLLG